MTQEVMLLSCHQTWWPKFHHQDPYTWRREPTVVHWHPHTHYAMCTPTPPPTHERYKDLQWLLLLVPEQAEARLLKASPCGMLSSITWYIVFHDSACAVPEAVLSFEHSWQLNWNRNHIASLVTMVMSNYHKYLLMTSLEKQARNRRMNIHRNTWDNSCYKDVFTSERILLFVPSYWLVPPYQSYLIFRNPCSHHKNFFYSNFSL